MNDLFISMEYNDRQFVGIDDFKSEIEKDYHCQIRPKWIPAYAEGAEVWLTVFVNTDIMKFLAGAIVGGATWDLVKAGTKKYLFKPLYEALEKLYQKNLEPWDGLKVVACSLQFDDCEIVITGVSKNFNKVFSAIFDEISKRKTVFEKEVGLEVIKIEMPIEFFEGRTNEHDSFHLDYYNEDYTSSALMSLWRITFATGFPVMIYSFKDDVLYEPKKLHEMLTSNHDKY